MGSLLRGGVQPSSELVIYDPGHWNVGYSFDYWRNTSGDYNPATLQSDRILFPSNSQKGSVIGTDLSINFTKYSMLYYVAKGLSTITSYYGVVWPTTVRGTASSWNGIPSGKAQNVSSNSIVEYAIDISDLTGNYYVAATNNANMSMEVYKIYLV